MKFIGTSTTSKKLQEQLEQLTSRKVDLLVLGETGTGKDYSVRYLWQQMDFHKFHASNLEEEITYFDKTELPNLYIDNIEELSLRAQLVVQKLLETRKLEIEGKAIQITGNIICSASPVILNRISEKQFREELFAKISGIKLSLPTLRERKEDILLFSKFFIDQWNAKHSKKIDSLSENLEEFLVGYYWPGNITQLATLLESQVVFTKGKVLDKKTIPKDFLESAVQSYTTQLKILPGVPMDDYEKEILKTNLLYTGGNREKTAKILRISERTLYRKIKKYEL